MILNGKKLAADIRREVTQEVTSLRQLGVIPKLAVISVGGDPASAVYVRNKEKACNEVGIECEVIHLPGNVSGREFYDTIHRVNWDDTIHAALVQLPLPSKFRHAPSCELIHYRKDVDAFSSLRTGELALGVNEIAPCTPAGIMELLKRYDIPVEGKRCVIIGRSDIVGKPLALMMLHANATVTICHSKTQNLKEICREADILVSAVGKPNFVRADMVKAGAIVIDVGINRAEDGKLVGDVAFDEVEPIASYITPVPGGVGPMTVAMLLKNVVALTKSQEGIK